MNTPPPTTMTCPRCKGTGQAPLREEMADTVEELTKGPASVKDMAQCFGMPHTAMSQRLERLRAAGMVKRHKESREWIYQLTEPRAA